MPIRKLASAAPILLALGLAACSGSGGSDSSAGGGGGTPPSTAPSTRYDLANRCFALQTLDTNSFVVREAAGYKATAASAGAAEPFYMKPTALGEYLFHGKDKALLVASGNSVGTAAEASPAANWIIELSPQGGFTAKSETTGQSLAVDAASRMLVQSATPGRFRFVPGTGCTPYPEISTDIVGETYKGRGVDKPVVGFAEVHAHQAMGHEMSDGKTLVGPSAGGVMYGQTIHRFGVPHALRDCAALHGQNGSLDPEAIVLDNQPLKFHDTQGWPTFVDWPARDSQLHQMMYYKWIERAWKAGLRVMVVEGTNIEALCEIGKIYASGLNPQSASMIDCDDMGVGVKQVRYLYQVQDYIDAQEGGPGKGWYRIVKDPFEARRVINDGKLAVVPGLEFSNVFQCNVTFTPADDANGGTAPDPRCTPEGIDQQIEEIWALGVREIFPYHDVNSALGGTGIFNGLALNLVGFLGTRRFWDTYDCPDGGEGDSYFYEAGARMYNDGAPGGFGDDPLTGFIVSNFQGLLPVYPTGKRQCNARGMTELGRYALQKLMEKKFVIDIDHAELSIKQDMIDMGKAQNPPYPFISAHGGHGGISTQQARDILAMGGLIYPAKPNGRGHKAFLEKLKPIWPADRPLALGFGMDGNGLANLAPPRGAGAEPVVYPFTLFRGPDWGPKFAGFTPLTVHMQTIPESGKFWHVDETGTAHFGLVADFIEEIRLEGGAEALDAFYNSAEAYLQMWEQIVCRGADKPAECAR
jgi:hypothetical protein